jgi:hypothetical protein
MSKKNLKRMRDEIQAALETAEHADITATDPDTSCIDADTFKQIAQPLRRALRLAGEGQTNSAKPTRAEADADLLFDIASGDGNNEGEPAYEIGCVLDEFLNPANRVYQRRDFFRMMYLDALRDKKRDHFEALAYTRIKTILRDLKRGVPASTIARQLKEKTFYKKGGAR